MSQDHDVDVNNLIQDDGSFGHFPGVGALGQNMVHLIFITYISSTFSPFGPASKHFT